LKALDLALIAHEGQHRRAIFTTPDGRRLKEDYINHPLRLAIRVRDLMRTMANKICDLFWTRDNQMAIALLHDTIEDSHVTAESLTANGFPKAVVDGVVALTRKPDQTYYDYVLNIPSAYHQIKLFDLSDNLDDLEEGSLKDKYRFARHFLIGCGG
jgi:(p)ppGpp synthase/HD superfamily hydrolase